jgi:hypothetical protein
MTTKHAKMFLVTVTMAAIGLSGLPAASGPSAISGSISDRARVPLANVSVPLRNLDTGEIVGTVRTDRSGAFSFTGVSSGQYVVEVVGVSGDLVAASTPVTVTSEKPAVSSMALSVPGDRTVGFQTTAAQVSKSPLAGQILRAAVLAGFKGSSIKVNEWRRGGGQGNGRGGDSDKDSDHKKKPKTPKKPRGDSDTDRDTDRDSDRNRNSNRR